jgi:hypothetical protein
VRSGVEQYLHALYSLRAWAGKSIFHCYNYIYTYIQKDRLNFVRLYFMNYTWHVNDLLNV